MMDFYTFKSPILNHCQSYNKFVNNHKSSRESKKKDYFRKIDSIIEIYIFRKNHSFEKIYLLFLYPLLLHLLYIKKASIFKRVRY